MKYTVLVTPAALLSSSFLSLTSAGSPSADRQLQSKSLWSRLFKSKPMYNRKENEKNAISVLDINGDRLSWFRLDDGVMGGQSESLHKSIRDGDDMLSFEGYINTDGGGFTSIRSNLPENMLSSRSKAVKLHLRGDGKTYKVFLTNGIPSAGPRSASPSWQADIPTISGKWQDVTIPFTHLHPSYGGPRRGRGHDEQIEFNASEMRQLGLMLSLKLSKGDDNPVETFGEGIFPFSLQVKSIHVVEDQPSSEL